MQSLSKLQRDVHEWKKRNFPNSGDLHQFLGLVEEVGELAHAILKSQQGIRGNDHVAEAKDAVGDIMIFLLNLCSENGWDLREILIETWEDVAERDWVTHPKDGRGE